MKCNFCGQGDIVVATMKDGKTKLAICDECDEVYEIDKNGKVVMDHDPNDVEYNERLNVLFKSWDDVLSYVKYDE